MTPLPDPATEAAAFLNLVREGLGVQLHRSTVPILSQRNGGRSGPVVVAGTGVLVAVDDARFLVSAAHVFAYKKKYGAVLCIPTGEGLCEDVGGDLATPEAPADEHADIGVLRLPDALARKVEALGAQFLRLAIALPIVPSKLPDGGYVVYGYPEDGARYDSKGELNPVPHYLGCIPYRGDTALLGSYDPNFHALLSLKRHEVRNQHTGEVETFPKPHGMSGSGVWWAYASKDVSEGWKPEYARLVAIQSAWYDDSALVVIPIQIMTKLIAEGWPELASAVMITAPPRP